MPSIFIAKRFCFFVYIYFFFFRLATTYHIVIIKNKKMSLIICVYLFSNCLFVDEKNTLNLIQFKFNLFNFYKTFSSK